MKQKKALFKLLTAFLLMTAISLYFVDLATVQAMNDEKATKSARNVVEVGLMMEKMLHTLSKPLFGFGAPLKSSASMDNYVARENAIASQRVLLAKGLKAKFVSCNIAYLGEMMALWPNDKNYTRLLRHRSHGILNRYGSI